MCKIIHILRQCHRTIDRKKNGTDGKSVQIAMRAICIGVGNSCDTYNNSDKYLQNRTHL